MSSLFAIEFNSREDTVHILWNGILNTFFPPYEPYCTGIKAAALTDNPALPPGIFEVYHCTIPGAQANYSKDKSL